jgi:hypothetical protein
MHDVGVLGVQRVAVTRFLGPGQPAGETQWNAKAGFGGQANVGSSVALARCPQYVQKHFA